MISVNSSQYSRAPYTVIIDFVRALALYTLHHSLPTQASAWLRRAGLIHRWFMSEIPLRNFRRSRQARAGYTALPEEEHSSSNSQDMPITTRAAAAAATTSARNAHKAVIRDQYEDDSEEATLLGGEEHQTQEMDHDLHAETASQVRVPRYRLLLISQRAVELKSFREKESGKGQVTYNPLPTYRCALHWCTVSGVSYRLTMVNSLHLFDWTVSCFPLQRNFRRDSLQTLSAIKNIMRSPSCPSFSTSSSSSSSTCTSCSLPCHSLYRLSRSVYFTSLEVREAKEKRRSVRGDVMESFPPEKLMFAAMDWNVSDL